MITASLPVSVRRDIVFDDIYDEEKDESGPVNYDKGSEFHTVVEPILDNLMEVTRDILNIPIIVVMCLTHKETQVGSHTEGEAGIMVATHGRNTGEDDGGGGKWYPDIMNVLMELLTNPELLRTIQMNMSAIRAMSQNPSRSIDLDNVDVDELRRDLKDGKLPPWIENLLGDNDDDDEEEE